jgi:two-component sensor histidine kinase
VTQAALIFTAGIACFLFVRLRGAQLQYRAAANELSTIQENSPVAILVVDQELRVRKANHAAARMASRSGPELLQGLLPGAALGCSHSKNNPEACTHASACAPCALRQAVLDTLRNGLPHRGIETWLPAGRPDARFLLISTAPVELNGSRVLVCVQDITAHKHAEESLEKALLEKTVLLKEIHHRVKNNLAVISSLLSMRADAAEIPDVRLALEDSQQRVRSIALIHEYLYGSEHLDRIDFAEYAHQLVQELQAVFVPERARVSVSVQAASIAVDVHRAVPCALILNELLMNVFKHAFPHGRAGEVRVTFAEPQPGVLELAVEDNGIGCLAAGDHRGRQSLGLRIVDILVKQLDGTLHRESVDGTRVVLRFAERPLLQSPLHVS